MGFIRWEITKDLNDMKDTNVRYHKPFVCVLFFAHRFPRIITDYTQWLRLRSHGKAVVYGVRCKAFLKRTKSDSADLFL